MALLFIRLPTSFLPDKDQGVFLAMTLLPVVAHPMRVPRKLLDNVRSVSVSVFMVNGFGFARRD
ncbi:hypothetical protein [Sodalis-like endosymbiont of Proechinophthirus fluctus]|uniref:hypothetical protein n=1 Tax=Sodalis-like endosymbiont of Proechinophthirus fluctus TaxID=1462730 RepID=UPI000A6A005A